MTWATAAFRHVGLFSRELGKRKIAFICARESPKELRLRRNSKGVRRVYVANEGFTPESAAATLTTQAGQSARVANSVA